MLRPVDAATATKKFPGSDGAVLEVKRWTWDCSYGFMIRAESEEDARNMAAAECGDEGPESWTDSDLSTCDIISADGAAEVVMQDFLTG